MYHKTMKLVPINRWFRGKKSRRFLASTLTFMFVFGTLAPCLAECLCCVVDTAHSGSTDHHQEADSSLTESSDQHGMACDSTSSALKIDAQHSSSSDICHIEESQCECCEINSNDTKFTSTVPIYTKPLKNAYSAQFYDDSTSQIAQNVYLPFPKFVRPVRPDGQIYIYNCVFLT